MDFAINIPFLASSCLLMSSLASASKNHTKTVVSQVSRKSGESTSQPDKGKQGLGAPENDERVRQATVEGAREVFCRSWPRGR